MIGPSLFLVRRGHRVIASCETAEQLRSAHAFILLAEKHIPDEDLRDQLWAAYTARTETIGRIDRESPLPLRPNFFGLRAYK